LAILAIYALGPMQLTLAVSRDLEQWKIVSSVYPFPPKLTMNGQFIRDFIAAESPCFALGLVEERKRQCGFLALRPDEVIPPEISALGFNFGHALLGRLLNSKSFSSFSSSMGSKRTTYWSIRTTTW
jgi:hypothetical protein